MIGIGNNILMKSNATEIVTAPGSVILLGNELQRDPAPTKISYDSGVSWNTIASLPSGTYTQAAMSANAVYQFIRGSNPYLSIDMGLTFTQIIGTATNVTNVTMSRNGQYMYGSISGSYPVKSSDYGTTWSQMTNAASMSYQTVICSGNGQYVTLVGSSSTGYVSNDYGATFTSKNVFYPLGNQSGTMSESGQYQFIFTGATNGLIIRSADYGSTWSNITNPQGKVGYSDMSDSGDLIIGVAQARETNFLIKSTNYGVSFSTESAPFSSYGKGITMVALGDIIYAGNEQDVQPKKSINYGASWSNFSGAPTRTTCIVTNKGIL